ncbi:MAG: type II toxin-antitoxin system YafQ family toxin [Candidatus Roizmanbacteria bacterium]|nr:type II toxin-antitoxin system YafQ family toxin [Candidatus Roizmanbacteria bacterium]
MAHFYPLTCLKSLKSVIVKLLTNKPLPAKFRNHKLVGSYVGRWECHIEPDWLLIYKIEKDVIIFERTGSHSDLFK